MRSATTVEKDRAHRNFREVPLSGVLVVALVLVWAVALVPVWVRRHDDAATPPVAGRVLPRRRRRLPRRDHSPRPRPARRRPLAPGEAAMLHRRRRTVAVLVGAVLLAVGGAVAGVVPLVAVPLFALPLVAYAVTLRRQAVAAARAARRERRRAMTRRAARFRDFAAPASTPEPVLVPEPVVVPEPVAEVPVAEVPVVADATGGPAYVELPDTGPAWRPVPVPLPTYVTAPPAPRVVDADWHEEDLLDGELPGDPAAYGLADDVTERKRAVGD